MEEIWAKYNQNDVMASAELLLQLVKEEALKLPDQDVSRVFIGGFSQGCVVSLAAYHSYEGPTPLGGVIALSGMQGLKMDPASIEKSKKELQKNTPLFVYHGANDTMILPRNSEMTYEYFSKYIYTGEYEQNYQYTCQDGLEHSLDMQEIGCIRDWLK